MTRAEFRYYSVHYAALLIDLDNTKWAQSILALGSFTDILHASIKRGKAERAITDFKNEIKTNYGKVALIIVQIRGHIIHQIKLNNRKGYWW